MMRVSKPSQKAKWRDGQPQHKQLQGLFIGSETPCNTLGPCSSTHITAHQLVRCNFDGKNPIVLIGCEGIEVMSVLNVLVSSAKKVETI